MHTPGFVLRVSNEDLFAGVNHALSSASKLRTALTANCQQLVDAICYSQELGHRSKSLASIVQIKPGGDDLLFLPKQC